MSCKLVWFRSLSDREVEVFSVTLILTVGLAIAFKQRAWPTFFIVASALMSFKWSDLVAMYECRLRVLLLV